MKVLLINGSPNEKGCTFTALMEAAAELQREGIETEVIQLGASPIRGCTACKACRKAGSHLGRCAFPDGNVNEAIEKIRESDGLIVGSPVHYAGVSGSVKSFLDRVFYAGSGFYGKPAAAVVSSRRGGSTSAFDQLNKYFMISSMPVVSSQYWNMVFGDTPEEVLSDLEGLQTMRTLAKNMAWLLKCIEAGRKNGVLEPGEEARLKTNFIR